MLSIIVRTLGNIKMLKRALQSINVSTYANIEVIVVYQGKNNTIFTDLKKLEKVFKRIQIKFISNSTDKDERSKNLNLGMQEISGTYLAFLDDDDYVAPNHYNNLISALKKSNSELAYNIVNIVGKDNNLKNTPFKGWYLDKLTFIKENFITINSFVLNVNLIDKSFLKFNEKLVLAEDYVFLLPIFLKYKSVYVNEKTSFYYIENDQSNSFETSDELGIRAAQFKIMKDFRKTLKIPLIEKINLKLNRILGKTIRA